MNVVLLFLFLQGHSVVGAQLFPGLLPNVETCKAQASTIIQEGAKDLPPGTTPFPICINAAEIWGGKNPTTTQKEASWL